MDNPVDIFYFDLLDDLFDDNLNNFGQFNYLFDYPGDNHDLLNYSLNFYYLGHFDHLLDELLDIHSNLFDSLHVSGYFDHSIFDVLDGFGNLDIVVDNLLNLDYLWLVDNLWLS
jgi:hypothetical protein